MNSITEAEFRRILKDSPRGGYLFFGEEDYLKLHALRAAREAVCPDPTFAAFNEMKLDAVTFSAEKFTEALQPLPMMAEVKLVSVTGLNFAALKKEEFEDLCDALSLLSEYDYNLVILSVASDGLDPGYLPKKPSPIFARLSEVLTPVYFEPCSTAKLTSWVARHFAHNGLTATDDDCRAFIEYCGHSMFTLASEIDKLSFYLLANRETAVRLDAMQKVCTPAAEYDAFAFTNALMNRDSDRALAILADYKFRRMDPIVILASAAQVVCDMIAVKSALTSGLSKAEIAKCTRLHEYRVGLYQKSVERVERKKLDALLAACLAADESLKSVDPSYAPLERLIASI